MFCKLGLGFEAPFPLFTCTNSCSVSLRPFPSLFPAPTSLLHLQEDRSRGREKVQPCLLKPRRGRSRWRSDPSWVVSLPTWRLVLYVPLYDPLQSEKKFFLFIKPSYPGPSLCHQLSLHPRILGQARGLPVAESHLFKGFIIMCTRLAVIGISFLFERGSNLLYEEKVVSVTIMSDVTIVCAVLLLGSSVFRC